MARGWRRFFRQNGANSMFSDRFSGIRGQRRGYKGENREGKRGGEWRNGARVSGMERGMGQNSKVIDLGNALSASRARSTFKTDTKTYLIIYIS